MKTQIFTLLMIALLAVSCSATKKTKQQAMDDTTDTTIIGSEWELAIFDGKPVSPAPNQQQATHFILQKDGKVMGFTGCNNFNGSYTLEEGKNIRFSKMASTKKYCPDLPVEEYGFLQVFEQTDNYLVNGNTLMLNAANNAPLAIFTKSDKSATE